MIKKLCTRMRWREFLIDRPSEYIDSFLGGFVITQRLPIQLLILSAAFIFLIFFWYTTKGMPVIQDQTESFNSFLAAENLNNHGLWQARLLEDWSTSSDPRAHPFLYTHNPDFPNLYSYLLLKLGVNSLTYQNFTAIFILLAGFWYFSQAMLVITRSSLASVIALLITATNYLGALVFGSNMYRSWTWMLVWGTIYHFISSGKYFGTRRGTIHFVVAATLYFFTVYYDYGIALLLTSLVFFTKLMGIYLGSWKKTLFFIFGTAIPSFAIHTALVISAIGFKVWIKDVTMTITNRAVGTPSREVLQEFYSEHYLVLWGYPELTLSEISHYLGTVFPQRIDTIFGGVTLWIAIFSIILALGYVFWVVTKLLVPATVVGKFIAVINRPSASLMMILRTDHEFFNLLKGKFTNPLKLVAAFMLSYLVVFLIFPGQTLLLYIGPFVPFFVFFLDALRALFLWAVLHTALVSIKKRMLIHASISVLVALGFILHTGSVTFRSFYDNYPKPLGSALVLDKYRGYSAVTNFQSSYVSYFTKEWATVMGWFNEPIKPPFESKYTFERDKSDNPGKYANPDFAILQAGHNQEIQFEEALWRLYPLVEKGADYEIYDLREQKVLTPSQSHEEIVYSKITLSPNEVTVSSENTDDQSATGAGKANLLDGIPMSYWHVEVPAKTTEHWILIDLGEEKRVNAIGVMPNVMSPRQIWHRDHAVVQVSSNNVDWTDIAKLVVNLENLEEGNPQWLYYPFKNSESYRYYRILIDDNFFLSISEIEVYESYWH